jgi:hypothetical protein
MKSIAEIMAGPLSTYTGSEATRALIEEQIKSRWGELELKNFDPFHNTRTFHSWLKLGFRVKRGEKSLRSFTCIETKDEHGNITKRYRKPVSLFYYRQVEELPSKLKNYGENNDRQLSK